MAATLHFSCAEPSAASTPPVSVSALITQPLENLEHSFLFFGIFFFFVLCLCSFVLFFLLFVLPVSGCILWIRPLKGPEALCVSHHSHAPPQPASGALSSGGAPDEPCFVCLSYVAGF